MPTNTNWYTIRDIEHCLHYRIFVAPASFADRHRDKLTTRKYNALKRGKVVLVYGTWIILDQHLPTNYALV